MDWVTAHWRDVLDISILTVLFYYVFRFIRGTRAAQMFVGLIVILALSFFAGYLQLNGLNWLISSLKTVWVLAFLILFQPELRKVLTSLGGGKVLGISRSHGFTIIGEVVRATETLSERRHGGLIAIERNVGLKNIVETGVRMEAQVTAELLVTLFTPRTPLHDGAVIISGDHIAAAGCILPLTQNPHLAYNLGTRHRAALGLSEESDSLVIVVSEETAEISVAEGGRLISNLDSGGLRSTLATLMSPRKSTQKKKAPAKAKKPRPAPQSEKPA